MPPKPFQTGHQRGASVQIPQPVGCVPHWDNHSNKKSVKATCLETASPQFSLGNPNGSNLLFHTLGPFTWASHRDVMSLINLYTFEGLSYKLLLWQNPIVLQMVQTSLSCRMWDPPQMFGEVLQPILHSLKKHKSNPAVSDVQYVRNYFFLI